MAETNPTTQTTTTPAANKPGETKQQQPTPEQRIVQDLGGSATPAATLPGGNGGGGKVEKPAEGASASELATLINQAVETRLKPLQDELTKAQAVVKNVDERHKQQQQLDTFVTTTMKNFPNVVRELFDPAQPATWGQRAKEIEDSFKGYIDSQVAAGRLRYVDVGGANREGGKTPADYEPAPKLPDNATPEQKIAASLGSPARPTHGVRQQ
jgi:hypothetical protein